MKAFILSIVLVALCAVPCRACPPVQVQSFGVESFGAVQAFAPVVVQSVPVTTFAVQTFAVAQPVIVQNVVQQRSVIVRQRNVCGLGGCGNAAGVNVRVFGGGRGVSRQRSVQRFR